MSIGRNIRVLRKANGMTQEELARMIGKTSQAVSQYERESNYPSRATLEKIAVALDVKPSEITDDDIECASVRVVDPRELEVQRLFSQLNDQSRDVLIATARALLAAQGE